MSSWSQVLPSLWLGASLLLPLGACKAVGSPDAASGSAGGSGVDAPTGAIGDLKDNPTGPGLEPPLTGAPSAPGPSPQMPDNGSIQPEPSDMGNAGDGDADGDGDPSGADEDAGAADLAYSCSDFRPCGVSDACGDGLHCILLPFCAGRPGCIDPQRACSIACGSPNCALLESFPEQLRCN